MSSLEARLHALAEHPRRRAIVTILTLITLVMTLWPAVDEYLALSDSRAQLAKSLEAAQAEAADLPKFEQFAVDQAAELQYWESRTVREAETPRFREELVEVVRQSGCQMNRLDVGPTQRRSWTAEDDPLDEQAPSEKRPPTPYELSTRKLTLAVAGPLANVEALVRAVQDQDKTLYVGRLHERPLDAERQEISMELELWLLSLENRQPDVP